MPAAVLLLVVDDEAPVRSLVHYALAARGYQVLEAAGGAAAVAAYRAHPGVRGVLLDVHLPGMDGPAILAALQALDPAVRVAFTGGAPVDPAPLLALGAVAFLAKPFTIHELEAVAALVTGGGHPAC
jgi:CheY-like chemotaxis protein